jgi:hypothetical protein
MDVEPKAYTKTYQAKMYDGRWSNVESNMATRLCDNENMTILIIASMIAISLCCPMFLLL